MSRRTTLIGRALLRRCPNCGSGGTFRHWLAMKPSCPSCGHSLAPGNNVGALLLNLVVAEFVVLIGLAVVVIRTWPDPPWTLLQYGVPLLALISPLAFYPVSKMMFVALDLFMRPEGRPDEPAR